MSADPWGAFADAPAAPTSAAASVDPWAGFADAPAGAAHATQADGAPLGLANVPTAANDPIYHGAVPISQAPDQSATTAFASGVGGVPIVGPAILGGAERVAAGARSLAGGGSYDAELQHVQDMSTIARQQHPVAAIGGDLTGAALALAPATAAAPAAFGLGGPLTAGRALVGATSGAGLGAADAAVREGTDATSLGMGAATGAFGGAAAPILGAVGSRIGGAIADIASRTIAPPPEGMSRPAVDALSRVLVNDGTMGGQGAANIAAAGPRAMLADASPGFAGTLDTALQHGGPGGAAARAAVEARAAGANSDLTGALDQAFGQPQGVQTATSAIRDGSAAARQQAYEAAYSKPIDYTSDHGRTVEDIVANRVPPGIIARANNQMRVDGLSPTQQTMARVAPDGSVSYQQMPDVRQVDYITRSLNDVAKMGDGQGAIGGNTGEGRSYGQLASQLRTALRGAVPEYGTALDTAADPIQARNALEFGSSMLHPSVPRDVVANELSGMSAPEIAQVRQGLRSHISDTIANVGRTISDPNADARQAMSTVKMLTTDAARDKMSMLLDPAVHENVQGALGAAGRALELRGAVARNSSTYGRLAADDAVKQASQPGVVGRTLMSGLNPWKVSEPILEAITGNRPQDIAARATGLHGELASVLTGPQGPQAAGTLDSIIRSANVRDTASSIAGALPYGSLAHTGIFAPMFALQQRGLK